MKDHAERFWVKVRVRGEDECWEWLAAKGKGSKSKEHYGRFKLKGKCIQAHRVAYELAKGSIPEGFHIDHLCRNPLCVNPNHLEAVKPEVNWMRGHSETRANALKTHCSQGHPLSGENLMVYYENGRPRRKCRTCNKERSRKWRRCS